MRAAVLADDGLYFQAGFQPINAAEIKSIIDLLNLAEQFNCLQIWLLPGCNLFKRLRREYKQLFQVEDKCGWNYSPEELKNVISGWRNNNLFRIIFSGNPDPDADDDCQLTQHWPLEEITDARDLLAAIRWLIDKLGVYPSIPTRTAGLLIETGIKRSGQPLKPCLYSDLAFFARHKAPEIDWLRQPTVAEANKKYVHGFDKNWMFLSASNIPLGDGDNEGRAGCKFDKSLPGIWQATIKNLRSDVRAYVDMRAIEDREEKGRFWYYTPTLAIVEKYGGEITVEASYVWPDSRRVMSDFYKRVRAGLLLRGELRGPEQIAARSLKEVYTHFIGWLARHKGSDGQRLWRPDWHSMIVDEAYKRLILNIFEIEKETGMLPFGIHRDTLLYFSDEPHAELMPAPLAGEKSIYKHVFTCSAFDANFLIQSGYEVEELVGELKLRWQEARDNGARNSPGEETGGESGVGTPARGGRKRRVQESVSVSDANISAAAGPGRKAAKGAEAGAVAEIPRGARRSRTRANQAAQG